MNLALGFLLIFLFAVPGIVFRITYLSSLYSKRSINTTAIDEIFNSLIPALIFHSAFILLLQCFNFEVDFQFIFNLLTGNHSANNINLLNSYLRNFFLYMLVLTLFNFIAAYNLRKYVLKHQLYKRYPFLGIYNKWYYILKPVTKDDEKISVWLDVVVDAKNDTIIYRGFLTDFWLDREGGIKELHLEDVRRRILSKDTEVNTEDPISKENLINQSGNITESETINNIDKRYYYIPGELFIIKYEDVKNMNITYYEEISN